MQWAETYIKESRLHELFDFLGRYVRKTHTDDIVLRCMKASPGISYLDVIMSGDIAYVIALMKNARELWDQDLRQSAAGAAEMKCNEPKKKPKFTGGKGLKRLKGKSLWNKEGMTFFNTADENWQKVYNDDELRGVLCTGWENGWKSTDESCESGMDLIKHFIQ